MRSVGSFIWCAQSWLLHMNYANCNLNCPGGSGRGCGGGMGARPGSTIARVMLAGTLATSIIRTRPLHLGHTSTSSPKTRFRNQAQGCRPEYVLGGGGSLRNTGFRQRRMLLDSNICSCRGLSSCGSMPATPGTTSRLRDELGARTPWYLVM